MNTKDKEMQRTSELALVPSNIQVVAIAARFRWNPETVIARIEECLPSKIEQQIYLEVAHDFGIQPESFSVILREFLGQKQIMLQDMGEKGASKEIFDYLLQALDLLNQDRTDWDFRISVEIAAKLARIFGDDALNVITDVHNNLDEIQYIMHWQFGYRKAMHCALRHIIAQEEHGPTYISYDVLSYFTKEYQIQEWGLDEYDD